MAGRRVFSMLFAKAPRLNPSVSRITGLVCNVRFALCFAAALFIAGCSRAPRNELLIRYECKFKELDSPLPVAIDLGEQRMTIGVSPDTFISVPLSSLEGQLVFENDPRNDQSLKLWMRSDGSARLRTRLTAGSRATEILGRCEKKSH